MRKNLRKIAKFGFLIVAFMLTLSLIRSITVILGSNQKIKEEESRVLELSKENTELKKKAEIVTSTEFVEKQARDKLGLAKEGEIIVVPPDEATIRLFAPTRNNKDEEILPDPIWKRWLKLFI